VGGTGGRHGVCDHAAMNEDTASLPGRSRPLLWLLLWLLVGLGLRAAMAQAEADSVREWEADGFVRAWEGWSWGAWNRMRPPGVLALLGAVGRLEGTSDILGLRVACIGLSLFSLACGWALVASLVRSLRLPSPSRLLGCAWLTAIWTLSPTLVEVGVRPLPEALLGGVACLALAAGAAFGRNPSLLRTTLLAVALCGLLLVGGLVAALAVLAAALTWLAPVPRFRLALPFVLACVAAFAGAWRVQAGPAGSRSFMPDGAPAWSLAALLETPMALDASLPVDPDRRSLHVYAQALHQARELGALRVAGAFGRRCVFEQLGPARLAAHAGSALPLSLLDALLRGGALFFALATLGLARRTEEAAFPRAAVCVGVGALALLGVLLACSPFALAPVDLVVAALAAAGVCGSQPGRARVRWTAFLVGGGLMAWLVVSASLSGRQATVWLQQLKHETAQGARLVETLRAGGPRDLAGQLTAVALMVDAAAPFQRLPEAALRHAEAAVAAAPDQHQVLLALVRARMELLDLAGARDLALSLVDDAGVPVPEARAYLDVIATTEQRLREERLP